jgi:hypothetical protein
MAEVVAPVAGFSGVVAGVTFVDGKATTTDQRALGYFRRRGYTVAEPKPKNTRPAKPAPAKAEG